MDPLTSWVCLEAMGMPSDACCVCGSEMYRISSCSPDGIFVDLGDSCPFFFTETFAQLQLEAQRIAEGLVCTVANPPPTPEPTMEPSPEPTLEPTPEPTLEPSPEPTLQPTREDENSQRGAPSSSPTVACPGEPTPSPTAFTTSAPTVCTITTSPTLTTVTSSKVITKKTTKKETYDVESTCE